jgi:hypothetical protein
MVVCTIDCVSLNVEYLKKAHTQMSKSVKIDMIVKNNNLCCIFDRSYDQPQPDMSRVEESCFALRTTGNRTGVVFLNRKLELVLYLLMYYNYV